MADHQHQHQVQRDHLISLMREALANQRKPEVLHALSQKVLLASDDLRERSGLPRVGEAKGDVSDGVGGSSVLVPASRQLQVCGVSQPDRMGDAVLACCNAALSDRASQQASLFHGFFTDTASALETQTKVTADAHKLLGTTKSLLVLPPLLLRSELAEVQRLCLAVDQYGRDRVVTSESAEATLVLFAYPNGAVVPVVIAEKLSLCSQLVRSLYAMRTLNDLQLRTGARLAPM